MKEFLIEAFGNEKGLCIFNLQQERLISLLANTTGKSENQMNTLTNIILPRIALYQVLLEIPLEQEEAYALLENYMFGIVCKQMGAKLRQMEQIPSFYTAFRDYFIGNMDGNDNWVSEVIHSDDEYFTVHVHKCLWYDACTEHNCTELCRIFCQCDNVNFEPLQKVKFVRKGAIGQGQNLCDFTFVAR